MNINNTRDDLWDYYEDSQGEASYIIEYPPEPGGTGAAGEYATASGSMAAGEAGVPGGSAAGGEGAYTPAGGAVSLDSVGAAGAADTVDAAGTDDAAYAAADTGEANARAGVGADGGYERDGRYGGGVRYGGLRRRVNAAPIGQLYRESVKKRERRRRSSAIKILAACFGSAMFGGALVFACILLFWPAVAAQFFGYSPAYNSPQREVVRTYEFESVDSPIEAIYEKVSQSVVCIRVASPYNDFFFGRQTATGECSGIIIRPDGFIITSGSMLSGGYAQYAPSDPSGSSESGGVKIEVVLPFEPDKTYAARLVSRDSKTDIAVLKIEAANLPVAELGDSDLLKHGELVVAVGSRDGSGSVGPVTDGIISGLRGGVNAESAAETELISTNAAINRSNSGGALANSKGQVIGVNVIRSESQSGGIGFAIPINSARRVADNLIEFNYVRGRAWTGIVYAEEFNDNFEFYKQQYPDIPGGVFVASVEPLSGAFKAGVQARDIITEFNGAAVGHYSDMDAAVDSLAPGDIVPIKVYREGETLSFEIELSEEMGEQSDSAD